MKNLFATLAFATFALAGCNNSNNSASTATPSAPVAAVAPPAGTDWTTTVVKTPDEGFLMGNPNAPVKLIEYGALSCPHCAHFEHESGDELKAMIASGRVSYELRTYLIHMQIDLPASILARCNGPATFFGMADQMFENQKEWASDDKFKLLTPEVQKTWVNMTPNQLAVDVAKRFDMVSFVEKRGLSADKANACLNDKANIAPLQKILTSGNDTFHITGTPSFILNGTLLTDVSDWTALKPHLKAALGG